VALQPVGRAGAADGRNLGDSKGQQETTNLEVSGGSQRLAWGAKLLDWAFTRQRPQVRNLSRPPGQTVPETLCVRLAVSRLSAGHLETIPERSRVRIGCLPSAVLGFATANRSDQGRCHGLEA
jgi:hypothetical protein